MVDALASGASDRKVVEVQVLSAAPPESLTDRASRRGDALSVLARDGMRLMDSPNRASYNSANIEQHSPASGVPDRI